MISTRSTAADGIVLMSTTPRGVARRRAAAVEQHEVAVGAEAAQRDGCRTRRVGRGRLDVATAVRRSWRA